MSATTEPLGTRFTHLWAATGLSNLADGLLMVGVPLVALGLTREPAQISLVSAAATLPWLLLSLHVGLLVDRYDRVRILVVALTARVVVLVAGVLLAVSGHLTLPTLLALLLVLGSAEVLADSSASVLVPAVVPRSRLAAANSRLLGVQQLANSFLGGPLAGVLVGIGTGWVLGVPAGLCVLAALLVLRGLHGRVAGPEPEAGAREEGAPRQVRADLVEGLGYLWRHRVVRSFLVTSTALNFSSAAYFAVFVLWAVGPTSRIGMAEATFGLLTAALASGALVGAVVTERLTRRFSEAGLIAFAWTGNTLLLAVPVLLPDVRAVAVALVLVGFTNMVGNVVGQSMRQRLVPARLLGRVSGASRMVSYGSMPLGAALGGLVGQAFGLPTVFLGAVVLGLVAVLWVVREVPQSRIDEADAARADVVVAVRPADHRADG